VYGAEIIQLLINEEPPSVVCAQIDLCSSSLKPVVIQEEKAPAAIDCTICQFLVGYIDQELESNYSQANIERVLDYVCDIVPSSLRSTCTAFVASYTPQLIQLLVNEASPEQVCTALNLCSSVIEVTKPEGELCVICEFVLATAEQYLTGNETEQQVILFIENVCYLLPSSIRSECDDLIATYGPEIIQLLVQKEPPATVCTQLDLCSSTKQEQAPPVHEPKGSIECMLCQYIISAAEEYVGSNSTEQEVEEILDKICADLPTDYQTMCKDFVTTYGPEVIDDILNEEPPLKVCTQIDLCSSPLQKQPIIAMDFN
jgi:saposin